MPEEKKKEKKAAKPKRFKKVLLDAAGKTLAVFVKGEGFYRREGSFDDVEQTAYGAFTSGVSAKQLSQEELDKLAK